MYLHIGDEKEVFAGKIICILNYKSLNNAHEIMNAYGYEIVDISGGNINSIVIAAQTGKKEIMAYLSSISTSTLKKRLYK